MGEDMTYTTEPTRAELAARVAELERENTALTREVAGLRYYIGQLERNVTQEERAYAAGIASLLLTAQIADEPDAPLKLATVEDDE